MTATSAAANPLPPSPTGVPYAPTPKKDEAWVPQAPRTRNHKKPHPTWYGTHRTVAPPVQKFPFRPLDNRRCHDNHRSKPRQSAEAALTTKHTPTTPTSSPSPSYPKDALTCAFATLYNDIQAFLHLELKLLMSSTPNPFLPPNPPTFRPARPKKRPTTSTTAP